MALEKDLVRALRPLSLGAVPTSAISSLFDTGGTAALREEWVDGVSRHQLRALERVFSKFLRRQQNASTDEQVARLWGFFASQEAIKAVVEDAENADAVYRSLLTLLQAVLNVRDVYAVMGDTEKRRALLKALVAAKVYLVWLQLPGGSAYGLFMSYVYRQVLDALKKWVVLIATKDQSNGTAASQKRAGRRGRRPATKEPNSDEESDDNSHAVNQMLTTYGLELLEMLVAFLGNFSLAASKESIVPTIETAIALQTALPPENEGTASAMTGKTVQMLEALVSGTHGEPLQIGRVILHCYIPGVTFQESVAKENRAALRFHKLAIDVITRTQQSTAKACEEDDAEGNARRENSLMLLGLIQNICLQAPGLADERQRVLSYVFSTALAGRRDSELEERERPNEFRDEECVRLARFLISYSRNSKLKYRQFAVELISRLVVEARFWKVKEDELPEDLIAYSGVGPLLEVLIDRARDKMSQVRTKAIGGISTVLTLGLSNLVSGDDEDGDKQMTDDNRSEAIATSLQNLLYESSIDAEGNTTLEETPLMQRLIDLFRERLVDEKTFVRRAAVQALEALLTAHSGDTVLASSRKDLFDIHARCTDTSVVVRVQSIKSLSAILLKFPGDEEAQKLWNLGVLPLCVDPETSVQSCALDAAGRVVFDRVLTWYDSRRNKTQREALECVWMQVSHLDGVMARCLQKAMRMLIKSEKIAVDNFVKACIFAIKESVSPYSSGVEVQEETEDEATRRLLTRYWGFSWVVLEELAHSGKLIEAVKGKQQNLGIVVECWNKLQDQALPIEFNDGSKRILRVIAAISTVIDAQDAKSIADSILASLHSFAIPLNVIADGILALNSICKAKAPSPEKGRDISFAWGNKLLELCEANLRKCFESSPDSVEEETALLQKQLISIGEVALLEFDKDADKSGEAALLPVSSSLKSLVQLFLPPKFVPNSNVINHSDEDETAASVVSGPVPLPTPVRVCAFVTLGKLCLRDQELAKKCVTMFIRELRTCDEQDIRSNILLILGDLCIRYTSLVDAYVPTIALSLLDESRLLRRSALLLFSQLILQDYIKWRESLLRFFLRAAVDEDEELANLARHVLCGPLLQKSPHIFTNKFIEIIFVFNGVNGDKLRFSEPFEEEGTRELALLGNALYPRRAKLYNFLLEHMTDEQKLQISMKLCNEVLEEVMDGTLPLCENPSQITDQCTEAVLKDTFAILCSPEIKLTTSKEDEDEEADNEDVAAGANANVASQIAAAKGKLLSKMSKKNFLENVVPVLIGLKHTLEAKHSPLTRYLLHYIRELFKMYRQEVKDIFMNTDPQMAMEVEYDLRQLDLQQQQQKQASRRMSYAPSDAQTAPMSPSANAAVREPPTPQEQLLEASHTPVRLRGDEKSRRRQSLPATPTPTHSNVKPREVSSEESRRQASENSTLIFSPSQGHPANENWQVTAKSPSVDKPQGRGKQGFTQEDLEGRMKKNLAAAFDSAGDSDDSEIAPPTVNTSRRRANMKAKAKATKSSKAVVAEEQETEGEAENDEEVVPLPLKKKKTKSTKKSDASAASSRPKRKRNK
ncbi:Condensin-2 complex subunit D3 [Phytophthora ramorum]|uniref:Condensin complex subunit 1 C-terminal domain-containing protein n=1 Tax=Phytophthora ramorum TaxID=164328 RepID=H3GMN9_PHYRM|nr:Condensin-2 complex subunit D3 [Phytophthora ramorum]